MLSIETEKDRSDIGYAYALDPRSVVNLMIDYTCKRQRPLSNLAIQKLLYFAHATFLVRHGRPLVSGVFEAWEYGPVHRLIYDALKPYGRNCVNVPIRKRDPFSGEESQIPAPQALAIQDHVAEVMRTWGRLPPGYLVDISHAKDGPWHYVWERKKTDPILGNVISDTITRERFARLKVSVTDVPKIGDVDEATPYFTD